MDINRLLNWLDASTCNFLAVDTIRRELEAAGFTVALNKELPCNDGGVSFGQAVIAAARHAGADAQK